MIIGIDISTVVSFLQDRLERIDLADFSGVVCNKWLGTFALTSVTHARLEHGYACFECKLAVKWMGVTSVDVTVGSVELFQYLRDFIGTKTVCRVYLDQELSKAVVGCPFGITLHKWVELKDIGVEDGSVQFHFIETADFDHEHDASKQVI